MAAPPAPLCTPVWWDAALPLSAEQRTGAGLVTHAPHSAGQVLTGLAWCEPMQATLHSAGEDFPVYGLHVAGL